jgi:uncharacterized protein
MWSVISRLILRNRPGILIGVGLITIVMGWLATGVTMSYNSERMLPLNDPDYKQYEAFKKTFGEDGNVLVIGVTNPNMFRLDQFNAWFDLCTELKNIEGVQGVASITKAIDLVKDDSLHKFRTMPLVPAKPTNQAELDSLKQKVLNMKFYQGFLYNPETNAFVIAITLDKNKMNDKRRLVIVDKIKSKADAYASATGNQLHYSGMPYIRSVMMNKIKHELYLFIILSIAIAAIILYLFFRSVKVVLSSLVVVSVSIIWTVGLISLMGFKLTVLTALIPSLIVIIAIENCIYILNKYHWEYRAHGNKIKSLTRVVHRIGFASLMVNTATAAGFAAFILVSNQMLRQFGIITSISILLEYALSLVLLTILFSYQKPPEKKHLKHLDSKIFVGVLSRIINVIQYKRKMVYIVAGIALVFGVIGILKIKTSGRVVDDLRKNDKLYVDLKYFEKNLGGVMPFEIMLDTKKKNGVLKLSTIEKIDELQTLISSYGHFTRPLSIAELVKFAKQSYFNGDPDYYELPNSQEKNFILSYLPGGSNNKDNMLHSFIDSTRQQTRISFQMEDLGTAKLNALLDSLRPRIDSIFNPEDYSVIITGNVMTQTKGTTFLISHLIQSVIIAIIFISLLLALMFSSFRMIVVSMLPNIAPLLLTAAIMGYTGIPIKPSTIIVFSIALGISVDNAIQYLSRYRHELKATGHNIKQSAINALREAGFSMIYTSIVLVFGFSIFIASGFGGTQALGILVSTTLFIAMFFNMLVLPSLLLSLDKYLVTKAFESQPLIEIFDGDDDETGSNKK